MWHNRLTLRRSYVLCVESFTTLPDGELTKLPSNFFMDNLKELISKETDNDEDDMNGMAGSDGEVVVGGGPRVVVSTAAFHARVRGSVPGLGGFKETKMFLPHPRVKVSIVGSLRDREVACSASDRQGFRILCLEDSVISIISPSSGGSPGPV